MGAGEVPRSISGVLQVVAGKVKVPLLPFGVEGTKNDPSLSTESGSFSSFACLYCSCSARRYSCWVSAPSVKEAETEGADSIEPLDKLSSSAGSIEGARDSSSRAVDSAVEA